MTLEYISHLPVSVLISVAVLDAVFSSAFAYFVCLFTGAVEIEYDGCYDNDGGNICF